MKRTSPPCLLDRFWRIRRPRHAQAAAGAIFHLAGQDLLDPAFTVLGFARTEMNDEQFREQAVAALREHVQSENEGTFKKHR
jgi:glucose-6-phosphate 1-dehydrogenase